MDVEEGSEAPAGELLSEGARLRLPGGIWMQKDHGSQWRLRIGGPLGEAGIWDMHAELGTETAFEHVRGMALSCGARDLLGWLGSATPLGELVERGSGAGFPDGTWLRGDLRRRLILYGTGGPGPGGSAPLGEHGSLDEALAGLRSIGSFWSSQEDAPDGSGPVHRILP